jgi:26S proteasome regulatory subunit N12
MASQLKTLYEEHNRAFFSKPSDLKKCVAILSKLKVCSLLTYLTHFCSLS